MKSLFKPVKNKPKVDKSFDFVESRLKDSNLAPTNDIATISKWFKTKYETKYGKPMLGYNFFNCRHTIQLIAQKYKCNHWEVCCMINNWFASFHGLGYDKVASDDSLTLSVLKTDWIVSGMKDNRRPNESKRNSSYKTHGQSRRIQGQQNTGPNKNQISNQSF